MRIRTLTTGFYESHCYLIIEGNHAFLIDPGDSDLVRNAVLEDDLTLDFGILTHEHCDHVYGCTTVRDVFHCRMISSLSCDKNLKDSRKNYSKYYDSFIDIQTRLPVETQRNMEQFTTYADETFEKEKNIEWCGHTVHMRETPGHSSGSICIVFDDELLFSGDTLMKDDSTETHFLGGDKKKFALVTVPWLKSLPESMIVYPGHGDVFRLGDRCREL